MLVIGFTATLSVQAQEGPSIFLPAGTYTLEEVLVALTEQGASISYRPDQLPTVAIDLPEDIRPPAAWLDLLLRDTELTYEQGSAGILILPDAALLARTLSLYGMVSDAVTGERLIGATVQLRTPIPVPSRTNTVFIPSPNPAAGIDCAPPTSDTVR